MEDNLKKFNDFLKQGESVLIIMSRPLDFDCIGSGLLLKKYLESLDKIVTLQFPRKMFIDEKKYFDFLPFVKEIKDEDTRKVLSKRNFNLLILVDGSNLIQYYDEDSFNPIPNLDQYPKRLHIDHHLYHPEKLGTVEIYETEVTSTTEIILRDLIPNEFLDDQLATLGYAGIAGDTGNFRWGLSPGALELSARLLKLGANYLEIVERSFFHKDKVYLSMLSYAIEQSLYNKKLKTIFLLLPKIKLSQDRISRKKLEKIKDAFQQDVSRSVRGYDRGLIVYEWVPGKIQISARGNNMTNKIDLPKLLGNLGGNAGGHFNACGADVEGNFEEIKNKLKDLLKEELVS